MSRSPVNSRHTAILFSGGGVKGAVQVGYMDHIIGELHWPIHWVRGVSTGALQASILAQGQNSGLRLLNALWKGLEKDSDLFDEFPWWRKAYNVVRGSAFASNKPLAKLLERYVDTQKIKVSGIDLKVGVTNFNTKSFYEVGPEQMDSNQFLQFVLASTCIPGEFAGQLIEALPGCGLPGGWFFDGGVTNMIPTMEGLINQTKVERIVVCLCNPIDLGVDDVKYNRLIRNVKEALSIAMHDNWMGDLKFMQRLIERTNQKIRDRAPGYESKRTIDFIILAPQTPVPVGTLDVDPLKIRQTINIGRMLAEEEIGRYYKESAA